MVVNAIKIPKKRKRGRRGEGRGERGGERRPWRSPAGSALRLRYFFNMSVYFGDLILCRYFIQCDLCILVFNDI